MPFETAALPAGEGGHPGRKIKSKVGQEKEWANQQQRALRFF
jgi:hypothetical protein